MNQGRNSQDSPLHDSTDLGSYDTSLVKRDLKMSELLIPKIAIWITHRLISCMSRKVYKTLQCILFILFPQISCCMFHLICDGVIHAWKGEQKLTMIWNHIHVHCISLHILHIHCISYSTMFAEQINVRGKVKKKLFGMGKPIYTCAHTINVLTTVIKWVNVRNSSHVWHGKISGGGGKWSNIQSWAFC